MKLSIYAILTSMLFATSSFLQYSVAKEVLMSETEREVVRVAQDYLTDRFPDFDSRLRLPVVHDRGNSWEIEYELPIGVIGGTPVVIIDKATLKVLRSIHTQ
jgi:NTF2 fold immunity protein